MKKLSIAERESLYRLTQAGTDFTVFMQWLKDSIEDRRNDGDQASDLIGICRAQGSVRELKQIIEAFDTAQDLIQKQREKNFKLPRLNTNTA